MDTGELARAKERYLGLLLHDRYNHDAMLGLAEVFVASDEFESARVVLAQAVARHPASARAHGALGGVLLELDDLAGAREAFVTSLRMNPAQRNAWAGLGVVFERAGDLQAADHAWREAFAQGGPAVSAFRGDAEPIRVLLLRSAVDGNIPLRAVLDDRIHQWITLFVESFHDQMILPSHTVVFNLVGNADLHTRALERADSALRATSAPVINPPALVRTSGRAQIADRLRGLPGIVTPRIRQRPRGELGDLGLGWPLLVRSPGFHTGEHFVKIDDPSNLRDAVAELPGDELLAIEYLDTRGDDGMLRKYRVLTIEGRLYPLHLATSGEWKVHYFSAERRAEFRAQERAFLENMEAAIGSDATAALQRVAQELAFDYGGIDFALDREGRVVVFEANPTMAIVPPPAQPGEEDRRRAAERAIDATRAMIERRAAQPRPF